MPGQIEKLKKAGLVNDATLEKLTDEQKQALDGLSDSEVQTLQNIRSKAGGLSTAQDTSGTYPL